MIDINLENTVKGKQMCNLKFNSMFFVESTTFMLPQERLTRKNNQDGEFLLLRDDIDHR